MIYFKENKDRPSSRELNVNAAAQAAAAHLAAAAAFNVAQHTQQAHQLHQHNQTFSVNGCSVSAGAATVPSSSSSSAAVAAAMHFGGVTSFNALNPFPRNFLLTNNYS